MAAKAKADKTEEVEPETAPRAPIATEWAGSVRWQCPFCARDGGDRDLIEAHIADAHPEPALSVTEILAAQLAPEPTAKEPANGASDQSSGDETPTNEKGE